MDDETKLAVIPPAVLGNKWKSQELTAALLSHYATEMESVLPKAVAGNAEMFIKRAMLSITTAPPKVARKLRESTGKSIILGVVKAAELGLPIDNKLGYLVPYFNNSIGAFEAQFQPSYLGLLTVAKRSGQIKNAFAEMVYENDLFEHGRSGADCKLNHTWALGRDRGKRLAAYAVVQFADGTWTYTIMELPELEAIRSRSRAANDGPWVTDTDQMYLKTVLRRALKLYCNDPGFIQVAELDEREWREEHEPKPAGEKPRTLAEVAAKLTPAPLKVAPVAIDDEPEPAAEEPALPDAAESAVEEEAIAEQIISELRDMLALSSTREHVEHARTVSKRTAAERLPAWENLATEIDQLCAARGREIDPSAKKMTKSQQKRLLEQQGTTPAPEDDDVPF